MTFFVLSCTAVFHAVCLYGKQKDGVAPDIVTYNTCVTIAGQAGRLDQALELLRRASEEGGLELDVVRAQPARPPVLSSLELLVLVHVLWLVLWWRRFRVTVTSLLMYFLWGGGGSTLVSPAAVFSSFCCLFGVRCISY